MEKTNKPVYKLTLSAIFIALATGLSFIKVYELPLGGSITLLSMLPIVMLSVMLGIKWGLISAFAYAVIQMLLGLPAVLSWGLSPLTLVGTILFDYIIAFTVLGFGGTFAKKGYFGICLGTVLAVFLRFVSHFISGYVIFANFEPFEVFGETITGNAFLYSLCYNGSYMLPELIITTIAAVVLFRLPQINKLISQ